MTRTAPYLRSICRWREFYASAKDADYLIYNSTIYGEIQNLDDLFTKSPLLKDFKAVKEGHVWCTSSQTFQQVMGVADLIGDMHRMFLGEEGWDDLSVPTEVNAPREINAPRDAQ